MCKRSSNTLSVTIYIDRSFIRDRKEISKEDTNISSLSYCLLLLLILHSSMMNEELELTAQWKRSYYFSCLFFSSNIYTDYALITEHENNTSDVKDQYYSHWIQCIMTFLFIKSRLFSYSYVRFNLSFSSDHICACLVDLSSKQFFVYAWNSWRKRQKMKYHIGLRYLREKSR